MRALRAEITEAGLDLLMRVLPRDAKSRRKCWRRCQELRPVFLRCLRLMVGVEADEGK